jgi:hypothetical protein
VIRKIEDSSMGLYGRLDPVISIHNGAQYGSSAMSDGEVIYAVESFYHSIRLSAAVHSLQSQ